MNSVIILVFMFAYIAISDKSFGYASTPFDECDGPNRYQARNSHICGILRRGQHGGVQGYVQVQQTIHESDNVRLDAQLSASKPLDPKGPHTVGGGLDLTHKPTGSEFNVNIDHTKGGGNDVGVGAAYNMFQHGDTSVKATGQATQHFGGPGGSTKPDYQVGIQLESKI